MGGDNANISLFLHLFFVFIFIGGITVATVLRFTVALNAYKKASEIATILAIVRPLVAVVVSSLIVLIAFGFWAVSMIALCIISPSLN
jgi:uncharacterized membrane protein